MSRVHAHRLIGSSQVIDNLLPMGNNCNEIPINERQTRPLARLSPPLQIKAWEKAVETAIVLISE